MRVEVTPRRSSVVPGQPVVLTVEVFNSTSVISGYRVRVLGVDPQWVTIEGTDLSLFPETAGVAVASITLPPGIPASAANSIRHRSTALCRAPSTRPAAGLFRLAWAMGPSPWRHSTRNFRKPSRRP